MEPKFGYTKLVNAANKLLDGQERMRKALGDGIQLMDGFTALAVYEDISPVFRDGKALLNELLDLDGEEARAVYTEVAALRGSDVDSVEKAVLGSMDVLSDVYDFARYILRRGAAILEKAKNIF